MLKVRFFSSSALRMSWSLICPKCSVSSWFSSLLEPCRLRRPVCCSSATSAAVRGPTTLGRRLSPRVSVRWFCRSGASAVGGVLGVGVAVALAAAGRSLAPSTACVESGMWNTTALVDVGLSTAGVPSVVGMAGLMVIPPPCCGTPVCCTTGRGVGSLSLPSSSGAMNVDEVSCGYATSLMERVFWLMPICSL